MTIIGKLIYPNGLIHDYSISSVLTMKMLSCLAQIHPCSEWAGAWCLTGIRPLFYTSDDHMCTHETDHVSEIEMTVCVIYAYHMKAYISRWLDAGLQYLQCDDDEDADVLHKSVHFVYGQGPGA